MNRRLPRIPIKWIWIVGLIFVGIIGVLTWSRWFPTATSWIDDTVAIFRDGDASISGDTHDGDDSHDGHDHGSHAGHDEETSLELSQQALSNIGLSKETIQPVRLETFRRSITVPAVVVERPGRTRVQVATPMTGVITHVHAVRGEAVGTRNAAIQNPFDSRGSCKRPNGIRENVG